MYPQRSVMTCGLATALEPLHFNHAPVRGATGASFSRRSRAGSFNPRTRVGCDIDRMDVQGGDSRFQSTHPRGVRRVCLCQLSAGRRVSIHAPAWGATRAGAHVGLHEACVSIHAPAWGATRTSYANSIKRAVSIHAPAWGATCAHSLPASRCDVSIHAPAWGATVSMFYPVDSRD